MKNSYETFKATALITPMLDPRGGDQFSAYVQTATPLSESAVLERLRSVIPDLEPDNGRYALKIDTTADPSILAVTSPTLWFLFEASQLTAKALDGMIVPGFGRHTTLYDSAIQNAREPGSLIADHG